MLGRCFFVVLVATLSLLGCHGERVSGDALLVNMQPAAPAFAGAYDFDILEKFSKTECFKKSTELAKPEVYVHWVGGTSFENIPAAGRASIATVVSDVMDFHPDFDTVVLTRAVVKAKSVDETCVTVYGRGVRLKKAVPQAAVEAADSIEPEGSRPEPTEQSAPGNE